MGGVQEKFHAYLTPPRDGCERSASRSGRFTSGSTTPSSQLNSNMVLRHRIEPQSSGLPPCTLRGKGHPRTGHEGPKGE